MAFELDQEVAVSDPGGGFGLLIKWTKTLGVSTRHGDPLDKVSKYQLA
jgi:hypothetical protein